MSTIAIDWDDTLVGYKKHGEPKEWLPGAQEALRALLKSGRDVVIHSCRANWAEGLEEIHAKITSDPYFARRVAAGQLDIRQGEGKPLAMVYVDDRGFNFAGDWTDLVPRLKELSR